MRRLLSLFAIVLLLAGVHANSHAAVNAAAGKRVVALSAEATAADYFLTHPYLFADTDLRDTVAHDENVKANSFGLIKISADGWSDYHWDGPSGCVFNGINMSKAGTYILTWNGRNTGTVDIIVNGTTVQSVTIADGAEYPKQINVDLAAGENTIIIAKNAGWPGTYSIELQKASAAPDYYLSHAYLFADTDLRDTVAHNENVKANSFGLIKIFADGWSDYHWDGPSGCVFDGIVMSEAGTYTLTWNGRNTGTVDLIVNGTTVQSVVVADGAEYPKQINIDLVAGENTIIIAKNAGWPGTYSIELQKVVTDRTSPDYYLTNPYLFADTELRDTVAHDENVKVNNFGLIKLTSDGWSDYHWDGPSAALFEGINLSQGGMYNILWTGRNGGTVDVYANGTVAKTVTVAGSDFPYTIYNVQLAEGDNTIAIAKNSGWPGTYSIQLELASVIKDTTVITFDGNGGIVTTATIKAVKGEDLPAVSVPTRANYYFDGFWTEAEGGVQYYDNGGNGVKTWDKSDAAITLYAHWITGDIEIPTNVTCEDGTAVDYYLTHMYYALCTNWHAVVDTVNGVPTAKLDNGAYVLANADGNLFKLCSDGQYIDWHWDSFYGNSAIIYDNIFVSESGNYDIKWYQRNGGGVTVVINGDTLGNYTAGRHDTLTIYRAPLVAGQANTIKITKNTDWAQSLGIMLEKSAAELHTTTITLDMQGGTGGTAQVVATKGYDMPEITLPTRDGYVFEGYFTAADGGDKYYAMDGSSFKAWDKDDDTFTLYAHWNDGGTGGECPDDALAQTPNYWINRMFDARCTKLTNTWNMDNGAYIYTNVDGENIKITSNGQWMDFYWADPSSIVFDDIYVSEDGYFDLIWYFRCDNIDGDPLDGSLTHLYVNEELFEDVIVYISEPGLELDSTVVSNIELFGDWPNEIKLLKGNGWPLTRGIKIVGDVESGINNVGTKAFTVCGKNGELVLGSLEGENTIRVFNAAGMLLATDATNETEWRMQLPQGAYLVKVNGTTAKAIIR